MDETDRSAVEETDGRHAANQHGYQYKNGRWPSIAYDSRDVGAAPLERAQAVQALLHCAGLPAHWSAALENARGEAYPVDCESGGEPPNTARRTSRRNEVSGSHVL